MRMPSPSIVVLDGYTLNPGDLSWVPLLVLGECGIYDRTPPEEVVERAAGAEIILTNKTPVTAAMIARLPKLRYIGVLATGYNIVDVKAARARGIVVTNVPAYSTLSVAQLAFAHLLNLMQGVDHHARTVREGRWSTSPDFSYWDIPLVELSGLTMGIVGFGNIGQAVARIARAFGMKVLATDRPGPAAGQVPASGSMGTGSGDAGNATEESTGAGGGRPEGSPVEFVPIDDLFRMSDVVTLHCPLTEETRGLVNARRLTLMKPGAYLINTARGPLVDEEALVEALEERRIAGAGLDVLSIEPPPAGHPLLAAPNCQITPHIAWATVAARRRLLDAAVGNIRAFLHGTPTNAVS